MIVMSVVIVLLLLKFTNTAAIKGPPRIVGEVESPIVANAKEQVKLPCPINGNPAPIKSWEKDGESITVAWTRHKVNNKGLKINEVRGDDSGVYRCTAVNGFGTQKISIKLVILDFSGSKNDGRTFSSSDRAQLGARPKITEDSSQVLGRRIQRPISSDLMLKCLATGKPTPYVSWYKDGRLIQEGSHGSQRGLFLQQLQLTDSGVYTCRAYNHWGQDTRNFTLKVAESLKLRPEMEGEKLQNATVVEGQSIVLQCHIKSQQLPYIQWMKEIDDRMNGSVDFDGKLFSILNSTSMVALPGGNFINKLEISKARFRHAGLYVCLGTNRMGYTYQQSYLTVIPDSTTWKTSSNGVVITLICIPVAVVCCVAILAARFLRRKQTSSRPASYATTTATTTTTTGSTYPSSMSQYSQYHYTRGRNR